VQVWIIALGAFNALKNKQFIALLATITVAIEALRSLFSNRGCSLFVLDVLNGASAARARLTPQCGAGDLALQVAVSLRRRGR
jgi:hypothetical protein